MTPEAMRAMFGALSIPNGTAIGVLRRRSARGVGVVRLAGGWFRVSYRPAGRISDPTS